MNDNERMVYKCTDGYKLARMLESLNFQVYVYSVCVYVRV